MSTSRRLAAVLSLALMVAAAPAPTAARDRSPTPLAPEASPTVHGWPGSRAEPAGFYSWTIRSRRWMHNVPDDGSGPVEITFDTLEVPYGIPVDHIGLTSGDMFRPLPASLERVADVRMQAWGLDVDGLRVVIIVKSFPDTAPALVAEAEAIVGSIRVEAPTKRKGYRLVFALPAGWDSG